MVLFRKFEQLDGTFDSADSFHIVRNLHDVARITFGVLPNPRQRRFDWWTCVSKGYVQILTVRRQGLLVDLDSIRSRLTLNIQHVNIDPMNIMTYGLTTALQKQGL